VYGKTTCVAKLIYSLFMSLDGYTEDERGGFGWGAPYDEEVHSYINELTSSSGTYLYGGGCTRAVLNLLRMRSGPVLSMRSK
jgi:hypothetical protein